MRAFVVFWLALSSAGCGDSGDPGATSRAPEQNQRIETNWQEWMSRPPHAAATPAALPFAPEDAESLERLVRSGWTGLDAVVLEAIKGGDATAAWLEQFVAKDQDPTARAVAVFAIGRARRPRSAAALCSWLRDEAPEVSALAMLGLGELRVWWTLPRIAKDVGRYDANKQLVVRVLACAASLEFCNYSGIPFLLKILKEQTAIEDTAGRDWAKQQRMALEKEVAIDAIRRLAGDDFGFDPNASPAGQAASILKIEAWWDSNRPRLWDASPPIDDPALLERVAELVEAFDDYQISMVDNARFVLAWLGPKVVPHLLPHLADVRIYVRVHTLETIESLSDTLGADAANVMQAIAPHLKDREPAVRRAAVGAIGAIGREDSAALLSAGLDDPDRSVRIAVLRALGRVRSKFSEDALFARAAMAEHGDEWVAANTALAQLGHVEQLDILLQELMSEDVTQQSRVLDGLGLLGAPVAKFPLGGSFADRMSARNEIAVKLSRH